MERNYGYRLKGINSFAFNIHVENNDHGYKASYRKDIIDFIMSPIKRNHETSFPNCRNNGFSKTCRVSINFINDINPDNVSEALIFKAFIVNALNKTALSFSIPLKAHYFIDHFDNGNSTFFLWDNQFA
jgi:hypothetical protein